MDRSVDYDILPFPPARKVIVDAGRLASRRHIVHGLLELDVTAARDFVRGAKARGEDLSFTAFLVACFARAIAANPAVQAYRDGRGRLIVFHDVDVATPIEAAADAAAIPHIVRAANRRTVAEISAEIRTVQARPDKSQQTGGLVALGARAPRLARELFYWGIHLNPHWLRRTSGTAIVTSVGMFGRRGGWGVGFLPLHTIGLTVGGISQKPGVYEGQIAVRDYLNLTLSFDHDIVDGAPGARFTHAFTELVESASVFEPRA
jgi:pyruvate/2-oxoglutarate dehydrogenase complex dihydrolipoamide acyltransferase (E2) component